MAAGSPRPLAERARERLRTLPERSLLLRALLGAPFPTAALAFTFALVAAGALGRGLAEYAATVPRALTTPHTMEYAEGFVLHYATHWAAWYHPIAEAPFLVTNYPPLYYAVVGVVNVPLGSAFVAGRLVSALATLATGVLLAGLVHRGLDVPNPAPAALTALLFWAAAPVRYWGVTARVDVLGVALSVAALYWYVSHDAPGAASDAGTGARRWIGDRQLLGAGLLCLFALYTKQSYVAAPGAILLAEVWAGRWRRGLRFAVGLGAVGLALLAAGTLATGGRMWAHLVTYNANVFEWARVERWFGGAYLGSHAVLAGLGVALLGVYALDRRLDPPRVVLPYLAFGVGNALLIGKVGGWVNYFLHLSAGLALAAGVVTTAVLAREVRTRRLVRGAGTLALVGALALQGSALLAPGLPTGADLGPADERAAAMTADYVADADGPVLTSDPGLLVHNGQDVHYKPWLLKQLHEEGKWDQRPVVRRLEEGAYPYVVLRFNVDDGDHWLREFRWTDAQLRAVDEHYVYAIHLGPYWVYVPEGEREEAITESVPRSADVRRMPGWGSGSITAVGASG
jgi:hypothetical protein